MKYLVRAATVAVIVIILGTTAFAVAATQRSGPKKIAVIVTPMAASTEATTPARSFAATVAPAGSSASATPTSGKSSKTGSSTKRSSSSGSGKKSTSGSSSKSKNTEAAAPAQPRTPPQEPEREVVKPDVRDDGDHESENEKVESPQGVENESPSDHAEPAESSH